MLFAMKSPLLLYPFRYRDSLTGKWVRARYLAERRVIAERYAEWEITGPPELRPRGYATTFRPWREPPNRSAHLPPVEEPPPDHGPTPDPAPTEEPPPIEDQLERFLVLLFLRRYVTWCARTRRFAEMNRAALLHRTIAFPFAR
jgi:hypothetical protein